MTSIANPDGTRHLELEQVEALTLTTALSVIIDGERGLAGLRHGFDDAEVRALEAVKRKLTAPAANAQPTPASSAAPVLGSTSPFVGLPASRPIGAGELAAVVLGRKLYLACRTGDASLHVDGFVANGRWVRDVDGTPYYATGIEVGQWAIELEDEADGVGQ